MIVISLFHLKKRKVDFFIQDMHSEVIIFLHYIMELMFFLIYFGTLILDIKYNYRSNPPFVYRHSLLLTNGGLFSFVSYWNVLFQTNIQC